MFQIRKAERRQAKLRLALSGVSGCGKTYGAITIAKGMGGKTVVIDTEHRSADLFSHLANYDVITFDAPFTPERYIKAISQCEQAGYEIIIVDSLSHAWAGEGGALDMHDAATKASHSKNSYIAWKEITPWQNKLINKIIQSPSHIITTLRVKTHYDFVDVNGRKSPIKIGLSPVQRDGLEYEFTIVLNLDKESKMYSSSKDRTGIFEGTNEKITEETGKKILEWLQCGKNKEEIEEEEVNLFTSNINHCEDIDELRSIFVTAKNKYPSHRDIFAKIATERKHLLTLNTRNEVMS